MANMKISGLPDGATLNDRDMLEIARPGSPNASYRVSASYITTWIAGKPGSFTTSISLYGAAAIRKPINFYSDGICAFSAYASENGSTLFRIITNDANGNWKKDSIVINRTDGSVAVGGDFTPQYDSDSSCGTAGNRWSQIFAMSGSINTSDQTEKTLASETSPITLDILVDALSDLPTEVFQWNESISKKGADSARYHVGYIAQAVHAALIAKGIDPAKTALWCNDAVVSYVPSTAKDAQGNVYSTGSMQTLLDGQGNQVYRQGLRIDNLQAVLIEVLRRRVSNLETTVAALAKRMTALEAKA